MEDEGHQQSSEDGRGRPPRRFLLVPGVALLERQSWQASTTKGWWRSSLHLRNCNASYQYMSDKTNYIYAYYNCPARNDISISLREPRSGLCIKDAQKLGRSPPLAFFAVR